MKGFIKDEKGIALFLVLWVLTLLSVIAGEFCFAMRTEVNITRNFKEQTEAYYIALAGVNRAIGELIRNEVIPRKVKRPPFYRIVSVGKVEDSKIRQGVDILVEINRSIKKGYRIVQWRDSLEHRLEQPQGKVAIVTEKTVAFSNESRH